MITVYHLKVGGNGGGVFAFDESNLAHRIYSSLRPKEEEIAEAWKQGLYQKIATVDSSSLDEAYSLTNNGPISWSMDRNPGVNVESPLREDNGVKRGHRSSSIGDIFVLEETMYAVDFSGFKKLEFG